MGFALWMFGRKRKGGTGAGLARHGSAHQLIGNGALQGAGVECEVKRCAAQRAVERPELAVRGAFFRMQFAAAGVESDVTKIRAAPFDFIRVAGLGYFNVVALAPR